MSSTPPRIKLHFYPNYSTFGYWWKEIAFVPPIGTGVVPFEDTEGLDWEWYHDAVIVSDAMYFVEINLLCVLTDISGDWDFMPPEGFCEAMLRAGWVRGNATAWT